VALVLICFALVDSGCDRRAEAPQSPVAGVTGSPASSPTATASPTLSLDRSALQDKARAAVIAPNGMAAIGVSAAPKEEAGGEFVLTAACGKKVDADVSGVHVAYYRTWSDQGWWVQNTVHAYGTTIGADAVAQARAVVESCQTYTDDNGAHTLLGAVQLPQYPAVEARYGYCQSIERSGTPYVSCVAFLAKGNLVSTLWVIHGSAQKTNSNGLVGVGSVAAETLRKVP
jgi:hypothetical protein